jgi:cyclase
MALRAPDRLRDLLEAVEVIDLSADVADHADGPFRTRMEVIEAEPGARIMAEEVVPRLVPELRGRISADDFPDRSFLRHETVTASVHAGSHVDAPGHYGGRAERPFVEDAGVRRFVGPGLVIEGDRGRLGPDAVAAAVGQRDLRGVIPLLRVGGDGWVAPEAVERLLEGGAEVIGTDAASFDGSFERVLDAYAATGDPGALWPCHVLGRRRPYYQLECLRNLDRLPAEDFLVVAPPVLVRGATAAWARAVALVPTSEREGS